MTELAKTLRGYAVSRPMAGHWYVHRLQNILMRDYCARKGFQFLLTQTEVSVQGLYLVLEECFERMGGTDGIVLFSVFALPQNTKTRARLLERALESGKELHFALEDFVLRSETDGTQLENILRVQRSLEKTPFSGNYYQVISGKEDEQIEFFGVEPRSY